ncbi:MAG: hypothetical protein LQ340_002882 [Diploschistes diacapsis]|nr:MAG: hypothetical protein LQ340_002882 [Diploschistes diacapsis]
MTRGNQREKAREKNAKTLAAEKKKNSMSGSQQAADKEKVAAIMREKQAKGQQAYGYCLGPQDAEVQQRML